MVPIKSDAQRKAVAKFNAKSYDQIQIRVRKGYKDVITAHAAANGESLNGFINRAVEETIARETKGD